MKVNKSLVERLARVYRKYAKTGDVDLLEAIYKYAQSISEQLYGRDSKWLSISELFSSLCGVDPIKHCTNNEIIGVLNYLGIEVLDDERSKTE